eukprot:10987242-Alexandrium_andersonii.AAC.1
MLALAHVGISSLRFGPAPQRPWLPCSRARKLASGRRARVARSCRRRRRANFICKRRRRVRRLGRLCCLQVRASCLRRRE